MLQYSQSALKIMFFSHNELVSYGATVDGPHYSSLLQDKVRPSLHQKQPELMERSVIWLQDNATSHCQHDVENLVQCWGLGCTPYSPDLALCEDDINIAVTTSLCHRIQCCN